MTREEVIHDLQVLLDFYNEQTGAIPLCLKEAMAYINAVTPEPCEDAISRQAVLKYIEESEADLWHDSENELVCQDIKKFPPVTPQPKIGQWIKHDTGHSIYYDCSLCGCVAPCTETADKILWKMANYCPDCGARMDVVEEKWR